MRFLIDMNLSPEWVTFLRAKGHDASHWRDVGSGSAPDSALVAHASASGAVIVTSDLDFTTLLATGRRTGPSVIQIRGDRLQPEDIGEAVLLEIVAAASLLDTGAILTFDGLRGRVRVLPL